MIYFSSCRISNRNASHIFTMKTPNGRMAGWQNINKVSESSSCKM